MRTARPLASCFTLIYLCALIISILLLQPHLSTSARASSLEDNENDNDTHTMQASTEAALSSSSLSVHHFQLQQHQSSTLTLTPDWTLLAVLILLCCLTLAFSLISCYCAGSREWNTNNTFFNKLYTLHTNTHIIPYKAHALRDQLQLLSLQHNKQQQHHSSLMQPLLTDNLTQGIQPLLPPSSSPSSSSSPSPLSPILLSSLDADSELPAQQGDDIYLNEFSSLSSSLSRDTDAVFTLDSFDVSSITALLEDNKIQLNQFIQHQANMFYQLYSHMSRDLSTMKSLLAIKLSVTINKSQQGHIESIDRLVSGEILARESHHEVYQLYAKKIHVTLEELIALIRNIRATDNESYNIFPIKTILMRLIELIEKMELLWKNERFRRKELSAYTDIIGRPIVDLLTRIDTMQKSTVDDYLSAFLLFSVTCQELLQKIILEDLNHSNQMEKIDESNKTKLDYEKDRYHVTLMKILRDIQTQLTYLNEKLIAIEPVLYQINQQHILAWTHIQGPLLEQRTQQVIREQAQEKKKGRLFRGINAELAKVLSAIISIKGGLKEERVGDDDSEGVIVGRELFDPLDPFCPIFDAGVICTHGDHDTGMKKSLNEEDEEEEEDTEKKKKKHHHNKSVRIEEMSAAEADEDERQKHKKQKHKKKKDQQQEQQKKEKKAQADKALSVAASLQSIIARDDHQLETLIKKRQSIMAESTNSDADAAIAAENPAAQAAQLSAVDAEIAALLQSSAGESAHLVSAVLAVGEKQEADLKLESLELQRLKQELEHANTDLHELHSIQAKEQQKLNSVIVREEAEDAARYTLDFSAFDLLLEKMNLPVEERGVEAEELSEEEVEIRELMQQGITEPTLIRQLLIQKHAMERQGRRDSLIQLHAQQLSAATLHRASVLASIAEEEEYTAVLHTIDQLPLPAASSVTPSPDTQMIVSYVDDAGETHRVKLGIESYTQLCVFDTEHEEHKEALEIQKERNDLIIELAAAADSVAIEGGTEEEENTDEDAAASLSERVRAHENHRLDSALAQLPEQQRIPHLPRLIEHVMQDRHHEELTDLLKTLAAQRHTALMKALLASKERPEAQPDMSVLNKTVDEALAQQRSQAITDLEHQHRNEMLAAYQARDHAGDLSTVSFSSLQYEEVSERSAALVASLTAQQQQQEAALLQQQSKILNDPTLNEEEKAEAIKRLLSGIHNFDDRLAGEKKRQAALMQKKIEERQQKKHMQDEAAAQAAALQRQQAAQAESETAALKRKQAQQALIESVKQQKQREEARLAAEAAERQQLTDRLQRIESLIISLSEDAARWRQQQCYIDEVDAHDEEYRWHEGDVLLACEARSLPAHAAVLLHFAQQLTCVLYTAGLVRSSQHAPINVQIAASLPAPQFTQTAYMRSFYWVEDTNTLYIRQERLMDAAAFNLVLLYALAHISTVAEWRRTTQHGAVSAEEEAEAVAACWDDRDLRFLRHLHTLQKCMAGDFFFAATQRSRATFSQPASLSAHTLQAAIAALCQLHTVSSDTAVVCSARTYAHLPFFAESRLLARMQEYRAFKQETELQQYLISLEQQMMQKEQYRQREALQHTQLLLIQQQQHLSADNRHEQWLPMSQRAGEDLSMRECEDLCDEMHAAFIQLMQQMYVLSQQMAEKEKESSGSMSEEVRAECQRVRQQLCVLNEEKQVLSAQLQHVAQARSVLAAAATASLS